jgi:hypothetical protein
MGDVLDLNPGYFLIFERNCDSLSYLETYLITLQRTQIFSDWDSFRKSSNASNYNAVRILVFHEKDHVYSENSLTKTNARISNK